MQKDLPPVWEDLARASNHQQLLVMQRAFDADAKYMGLCTPTIAMPSLFKLVLVLCFWMESRDDLTTGLHPFVLGQHTATVRKFLCGQADRYAMVASDAGAPYSSDVEIFSAPEGVTLPRNFSMACGQWLRTRLIVGTCFGVDHNTSEGFREFGEEMSARDTELGEPSYFATLRSTGRTLFRTWRGFGRPWRTKNRGIPPSPQGTLSPTKPPTEAA